MNSFKVWTCEKRRGSRNDEKDYSFRGRERRWGGKTRRAVPFPHSLNYWFHFHSDRGRAILTPNLLNWGNVRNLEGRRKPLVSFIICINL